MHFAVGLDDALVFPMAAQGISGRMFRLKSRSLCNEASLQWIYMADWLISVLICSNAENFREGSRSVLEGSTSGLHSDSEFVKHAC
jgi:hypothetical protein